MNQYSPKFSNSENKWYGKIKNTYSFENQNTYSFENQNTTVVDPRTILESKIVLGGLVMSRIDDIVPEFVNAETVFQKVLSDKNSNSYEIRKAEQDFDKAVLKMKNEFNKAMSEITTKRGNYSIIGTHYSRRGAVHAR